MPFGESAAGAGFEVFFEFKSCIFIRKGNDDPENDWSFGFSGWNMTVFVSRDAILKIGSAAGISYTAIAFEDVDVPPHS